MDAQFELGVLKDGAIALFSSRRFAHDIKWVEFYRDMKLFKFVYDIETGDNDEDGDLMAYEVSDEAAQLIRTSSHNILVVEIEDPDNMTGFDVPLIQVGV